MIKCHCNVSPCDNGLCFSQHGCYKAHENTISLQNGCLTKSLKDTQCFTELTCCRRDFCNSNTTKIIQIKQISENSPVNLSLILPICAAVVLIGIICIIVIRKYHDYLSKYWKFYSNFSANGVNDRESYMKPFIEVDSSRFVVNNNCDGMFNNNNGQERSGGGLTQHLIQCDSCTSGSGSGMPFLVQRTIARQVQLIVAIGKGRFGEVWKGTYYGENVAVKIFASRDETSWARETHIYNTFLLRHPNILGYYASDVVSMYGCTQLWLITHYHELGSLYDYLHANVLNWEESLSILYSISAGLSHLHTEIVSGPHGKPCIAHRDLKSKNILVIQPGEACIADLGLSVLKLSTQHTNSMNCSVLPLMGSDSKHKVGTRRYMAPEILIECICNDFDNSHNNNNNSSQFHDNVTSCPTSLVLGSADHPTNAECFNLTQPACPINFQHFLSSDVFAFSLIMWEVISRTKISQEHSSLPMEYKVPFHDQVPMDPNIAEMRQLICIERARPKLPESLTNSSDSSYFELAELVQECWSEKSNIRPSALRIKKNIKSILMTVNGSTN